MAQPLTCLRPWMPMLPRRGGAVRAAPLLFLAALAAVLCAPRAVGPLQGASSRAFADSLFDLGKRPKVLFQYRDYELIWKPRTKNQFLPRMQIRKTPPKPISLGPISGSVEGGVDGTLTGFPFTTSNTGSVKVGLPRVSGNLKLGMEDPAVGSGMDTEEVPRAFEASYEQLVPGLGDITVRAKSTGEWGGSFSRQVEDLGQLRGEVNSQLDWSLDLDSTYPPIRGFVPSVTYGATQDGMRVHAKLDGFLDKSLRGSYGVQNQPGQYSPEDLTHDAKLTLTSGSGRHALEAQGTYDRKLPQGPVRGSLVYTLRLKPATMQASVDYDRYRLRANAGPAQVGAALARKGGAQARPAELELKLGQVSATALLRGDQPRVRLELGS